MEPKQVWEEACRLVGEEPLPFTTDFEEYINKYFGENGGMAVCFDIEANTGAGVHLYVTDGTLWPLPSPCMMGDDLEDACLKLATELMRRGLFPKRPLNQATSGISRLSSVVERVLAKVFRRGEGLHSEE